jgi:hypothetical protein
LLVTSPFLAVSRASGHGIVDTRIVGRGQDDGEHPVAVRRPYDTETAFIRLAGDRLPMAHFLHLLRYDMVACNVGDVPGIPDETADREHILL